jgi:hypothetical protein
VELAPVVTFGQSFHRTNRERVAETVYDLLEPGGSIAMVAHTANNRPEPSGPGYPLIPHEEIRSVIDTYLGPRRRSGQGYQTPPTDGWEDALGRTRFGKSRPGLCLRADRTSSETPTGSSPITCRCPMPPRTSSVTASAASRPMSANCSPRGRLRGSFGTGRGIPGSSSPSSLDSPRLDASSQGRASNTTLNGVSATRANELNPASITTSLMRASPACAPRASPTSCDKEQGVHRSVEKP